MHILLLTDLATELMSRQLALSHAATTTPCETTTMQSLMYYKTAQHRHLIVTHNNCQCIRYRYSSRCTKCHSAGVLTVTLAVTRYRYSSRCTKCHSAGVLTVTVAVTRYRYSSRCTKCHSAGVLTVTVAVTRYRYSSRCAKCHSAGVLTVTVAVTTGRQSSLSASTWATYK